MAPDDAKERIRSWAREVGISRIGIAPAERPPFAERFHEWIARGDHASMRYMDRPDVDRADPARLLDGCRSVICAALDYGQREDPAADDRSLGRVSVYAWGEDYHDVLAGKLREVARRMQEAWPASRSRVTVDTSPVLEKPFAARAGLGWIGKHTNLISAEVGSTFFLGEIFTTLELKADTPEVDRCGSCVRCIEVCPTQAIPGPYRLDARRCIAYWNIEHRGPIPEGIARAMGNWIFGCDLCQEVCPWNREAPITREIRFALRPGTVGVPLAIWERMGEDELRGRMRGSALGRARADGLRRNVQIASRNQRDARRGSMSQSSEPVVLYAASWSPECRIARRFLERHGIAHERIEIDRDPAAAEQLQRATGRRTVPVLRIGEEWFQAWDRQRGFRFRETAQRLGIPAGEVPEWGNA